MKAEGMMPERIGSEVPKHAALNIGGADLLLDGLERPRERPRQRPKDAEPQTTSYSGKSKSHRDKNGVLVHEPTGQVIYVSPTESGHVHDKKRADEAGIIYPDTATLTQDTGFQGYEPANISIYQPKKNERQALDCRGQIAQSCHFICSDLCRTCRIVKDVFRNGLDGLYDLAIEVACALHNWRLAFRAF